MAKAFGPGESEESTTVESLAEDATSVLLLSGHDADICPDLMLPDPVETENVLWVLYEDTPDRRLREWQQHGCGRPSNLGIISVGDGTRSASAAAGDGGNFGFVDTISHPEDLTGLGIRLDDYLQRWSDTPERTVVCFDSLTTLLQYVSDDTVYRFLNVLTSKLYAVEAFAHFHINPDAHDDETVEMLASLFDAVIQPDGDGWTVRSR